MRTALQQLCDNISKEMDSTVSNGGGELQEERLNVLNMVLNYATELLKEEKQQIIDAHSDGFLATQEDTDNYYNNTFNQ